MAPQSSRHGTSAPPPRRCRPAVFARLRRTDLEDRIAPALFTPQQPLFYSGMNNNGCVAVADFNRDGLQDAVLTNYGSGADAGDGNKIDVLYGLAGGGFNRTSIPTGGTNVSFVATGDINGDNFPDVVAVNANRQGVGSVSVFRNTGTGTLAQFGTPFATLGNNSCWVGLIDMTGEGVLDVVVSSFGKFDGTTVGNNVTIFQGNTDALGHGNFTFSSAPITTLSPAIQFLPTSLAVSDFDGDGFVDIVATVPGVPPTEDDPQPNGQIYVFRGTGSGGFAAPTQIDLSGALPVNIQAADLNADGKKDLIVSNAGDPNGNPEFINDSVNVLMNSSIPSSLSFEFPLALTANTYGTFATAIADFNLDGKADIAAINYGTQALTGQQAFVAVYQGNGLGAFTPSAPGTFNTGTGFGGGQYLAVGDFDNDTVPDLMVAHAIPFVGLLINDTSPTVRPTVAGVTINAGQANATQRSKVTSVTIAFNTQVTFTGTVAAAFGLSRIGGGQVGGFTATATVVNGHTEVTLTGFTGAETEFGSLADGRFTVLVRANQVTAGGLQLDGNGDGTSGDDYTLAGTVANGLYRLYGDVTGDGVVNAADFGPFRNAFGTATGNPLYLAFLDIDGDGFINAFDFGRFRQRFGSSVP